MKCEWMYCTGTIFLRSLYETIEKVLKAAVLYKAHECVVAAVKESFKCCM